METEKKAQSSMFETIIPKTKKECFALLDELLSDESKRAIVEMEDRHDIQSWLFGPVRLNCQKQESKVDVQSYVLLLFICPPDFLFSDYTYLISCRHTSFIKITWCKTYFVVPIDCKGVETE